MRYWHLRFAQPWPLAGMAGPYASYPIGRLCKLLNLQIAATICRDTAGLRPEACDGLVGPVFGAETVAYPVSMSIAIASIWLLDEGALALPSLGDKMARGG